MGPLASAELLRSIYLPWPWRVEQDSPRLLLWSDPMVVDRTAALERGGQDELREAVSHAVNGLINAGAVRVVIACVTAHAVLPALAANIRQACVSLVDVIDEELSRATEPHLLLCTHGSIRSGIFQHTLCEYPGLLTLTDGDQKALHREIYRLKQGCSPAGTVAFLRGLLPTYGVSACIAACTDLHLAAKEIQRTGDSDVSIIDPLTTVARRIRDEAI